MSEKQIENRLLNYLNLLQDGFYFKFENQGSVKGRIRTPIKKELKGISDIIGFNSKAIFTAIEVKNHEEYNYIMKHYDDLKNGTHTNKKKTHYQEQIRFIEEVKKRGGIAGFACSENCIDKILAN